MQFSKKSLQLLDSACSELRALFLFVIERTDIDFKIVETLRSPQRQKELFDKKLTKTLKSKHFVNKDGLSDAVDICLTGANPYGKERLIEYYYLGGFISACAKELGINLRWGGNFNENNSLTDDKFLDLVHYEVN